MGWILILDSTPLIINLSSPNDTVSPYISIFIDTYWFKLHMIMILKPPKSSSTNQRLPPQLRKGLALVVLPRDHGPHAGQGHEELRTFALGGGQGINGPTRKYSKVVYKSKWAGVYVITIL